MQICADSSFQNVKAQGLILDLHESSAIWVLDGTLLQSKESQIGVRIWGGCEDSGIGENAASTCRGSSAAAWYDHPLASTRASGRPRS